jgi:hypothetical protein
MKLKAKVYYFKPMRIIYLYISETNINRTYFSNSYLNLTGMSKKITERFELDYVEPVRQFLQKFLKVYPYNSRIYFNVGLCALNEPTEFILGIKNVDLVLAYTFDRTKLQSEITALQPGVVSTTVPNGNDININLKYMNPFGFCYSCERN